MMPAVYRWAGGALVLAAAAAALVHWHAGQVDDLVQQRLDEQLRQQQEASNRLLADAERRVTAAETKAAIAVLEGEIEQKRLSDLVDGAAVRARAADDRLQHAVADYRRRAAASGQSAGAAEFADEAAAVAGALGECSSEHRAVAEVADRLSIQVTGLQRYAAMVIQVCTLEGQGEVAP